MSMKLKRLASILVILAVTAEMLPCTVLAFESDKGPEITAIAKTVLPEDDRANSGGNVTGITGDIKWSINEETRTLTISPKNKKTKAAMPDFTYFGAPWSNYYFVIENVVISNGITNVGSYAFCDCTFLKSVKLPSGIKKIGQSAFARTRIEKIRIPNTVISIEKLAFYYCTGLTNLSLPNGVKTVGEAAFAGCEGLYSVTLPKTVTKIGSEAFDGCEKLETVEILGPADIGSYAFRKAGSLSILKLAKGVRSIGNSAFEGCHSLTSLTVPGSVVSIGDYAFESCSGLLKLTIQDGVRKIGPFAFANCYSLQSLTVPGSVSVIDTGAFSYCTGLVTVKLQRGVTSIGDKAFEDCTMLENLTIPYSVRSIGIIAFTENISLKEVTIPSSVTEIGYSVFSGCKRLEKVNITQEMLDKTDASAWAGCPATLIINILQDNPVKIKGKTATVRSKALKKKNQTIPASGAFSVNAKDQELEFVKVSGNKGIAVNRNTGKVTLKKKLKKGTYKVKVKVRAWGNDRYKTSDWKTVTVKIRVK